MGLSCRRPSAGRYLCSSWMWWLERTPYTTSKLMPEVKARYVPHRCAQEICGTLPVAVSGILAVRHAHGVFHVAVSMCRSCISAWTRVAFRWTML